MKPVINACFIGGRKTMKRHLYDPLFNLLNVRIFMVAAIIPLKRIYYD